MFGVVIDTIYERGDFKGSMSRKLFWQFQLFSILALGILAAIFALFGLITNQWGIMNGMIPAIFFVQLSHPAACARRLHDVRKSGWFQLIPFYNLYLFLQPSKESASVI